MDRLAFAFAFLTVLALPVAKATAADAPPPAQRAIQQQAPADQRVIQKKLDAVPNRAAQPVTPPNVRPAQATASKEPKSAPAQNVEAPVQRQVPIQDSGVSDGGSSGLTWPLGPNALTTTLPMFIGLFIAVIMVASSRARAFCATSGPKINSVSNVILPYAGIQGMVFALLIGLFQFIRLSIFANSADSIIPASTELAFDTLCFLLWYGTQTVPPLANQNKRFLKWLAFRGKRGADPHAKTVRTAEGSQTLGEIEHAARKGRSIADRLVSDRPLREGDPDPLGFGALARGISRFLRNRQTQTPLTLAVTGAWGTGKSSIMSLLESDLAREGFRPVWFNAWHHQQEAHLLAALLETMRVGAFPAWWTPGGIAFRLRLFWIRAKRRPGIFVLIGALLALQAGFVLSGAAPAVSDLIALLFDGDARKEDAAAGALTALPGIGAVFAVLLTMRTRFSNTFLDPARLTASVGRLAAVGRFRDRLSFRHRFGREFRDVVEALAPRKLVILVDDLDRCRPESVLEVLESVNFLVSSGECIVVMGLDRDRVVDSIAYSFKDVTTFLTNAEGATLSSAEGATRQDTVRQHAFAENYLEKLVNVEVAVPPLPPGAAVKLLREENAENTKAIGPNETGWRGTLAKAGPPLYAGTVILVLAGIAYWGGRLLTGGPENTGGDTTAGATNNIVTTKVDFPGGPWLTWILGIFVAGVILSEARRHFGRRLEERLLATGEILEDSSDFTDALEDWYPLMATRLRTPRALKRFINRLRFLAMMARDGDDAAADEIDEATFVGLAVVERCDPQTFAQLRKSGTDAVAGADYKAAKAKHVGRHKGKAWPPPIAVAQRFREISEGVVTRDEEGPKPSEAPDPVAEATKNAAE